MKIKFNESQIVFLNKLNFDFDINTDLTDDQIEIIDDKVSDYFSSNGIGPDDSITDEGLLCESIIDILSEL